MRLVSFLVRLVSFLVRFAYFPVKLALLAFFLVRLVRLASVGLRTEFQRSNSS